MLTYDQILSRLESIEADLATRQIPGEQAAESYFRVKRHFEMRFAEEFMKAEAPTATERKHKALLALMHDESYKTLVVAEAAYESWRAAQKTLETRSMIGMALLKAHTREAPQGGGPQPQWSRQ